MTNPGNSVGTNAAYSGRTSVNAFNDDLAAYTSGILSGWVCMPSSGLTITLGGEADTRDVAIAQDSAGNKTTINNISGSPISLTIGTPPASNSRIDAVVAYVDNPPQGVTAVADNPAACGLITVEGTAASTPVVPNDNAIRTAITADGASGATAYYVILAAITVPTGTTDLLQDYVQQGAKATLSSNQISNGSITADKIDFSTLGGNYSTTEQDTGFTWIDGNPIYKKTINFGTLPNAASKTVPHGITNLLRILKFEGYAYRPNTMTTYPIPFVSREIQTVSYNIGMTADNTNLEIGTGTDRSDITECYVTLYYTKSS